MWCLLEDTPVTHEDLEWYRRARLLEFDQLTNLRTSAEKWRNGLGALTGTLATVAILKGTDTFRELTPDGRRLAATALGASFFLLIVSSYCAMKAAFGQPKKKINSGEDLKSWTVAETGKGVKLLRAAQFLTPIALLFLAYGTAITWVDAGQSPKSLLAVVLADDSKICGTVQQSNDGEFVLLVDSKTSQQVHLRFADVRSLAVGKC